jgi:hypothetical protein
MDLKFAVLIDVDNISYSNAVQILDEIRHNGDIVICRAYGDWSNERLSQWKRQCLDLAIRPMMQFQEGKNSSDGLIFIDAIEIRSVLPCPVNAFCLVSTDSDFSSLSTRLREYGFYVMGIGNENAKKGYINTFQKYVYISNLTIKNVQTDYSDEKGIDALSDINPQKVFDEVYWSITNENAWVYLSTIGGKIRQKYPAFDHRTYGFYKLLDFVKALDNTYEIKTDDCWPPGHLIRAKEKENVKNEVVDTKIIGSIQRIIGTYGFLSYNNEAYYFHEVNLINMKIDELLLGSKVKFEIAKNPDKNGITHQEKNGIAINIEKL